MSFSINLRGKAKKCLKFSAAGDKISAKGEEIEALQTIIVMGDNKNNLHFAVYLSLLISEDFKLRNRLQFVPNTLC